MKGQKSKGAKQTPSASGFGTPGFGAPRGLSSFGASRGGDLAYVAEPPDFSSISDARVVVSFKNLLKKDSITKTKALDDFLSYVREHPYEKDGGTEEPVLEAWVRAAFLLRGIGIALLTSVTGSTLPQDVR